MQNLTSRIAAFVVLLCAPAFAWANEGRIPIYQSTTITSPGSYVVTNDFSAPSGAAITVAADYVSIDLNGHTVGGGVQVNVTFGNFHVTVENGHLIGGFGDNAPFAAPGKGPGPGPDPQTHSSSIVLDRLTIDGDISLDPCTGFRMTRCTVNGSVTIEGDIEQLGAHVLENVVSGVISLGSAGGCMIRGNTTGGLYVASGDLGSDSNLILGNTVSSTIDAGGTTQSTAIRDNDVGSINASGAIGHHIVGNSVRNGTIVAGIDTTVESNAIYGTGYCITADDSIYRTNIFQCTLGAISPNGSGNVDGGGNAP